MIFFFVTKRISFIFRTCINYLFIVYVYGILVTNSGTKISLNGFRILRHYAVFLHVFENSFTPLPPPPGISGRPVRSTICFVEKTIREHRTRSSVRSVRTVRRKARFFFPQRLFERSTPLPTDVVVEAIVLSTDVSLAVSNGLTASRVTFVLCPSDATQCAGDIVFSCSETVFARVSQRAVAGGTRSRAGVVAKSFEYISFRSDFSVSGANSPFWNTYARDVRPNKMTFRLAIGPM